MKKQPRVEDVYPIKKTCNVYKWDYNKMIDDLIEAKIIAPTHKEGEINGYEIIDDSVKGCSYNMYGTDYVSLELDLMKKYATNNRK
jgi:predicted transcriptional regulator